MKEVVVPLGGKPKKDDTPEKSFWDTLSDTFSSFGGSFSRKAKPEPVSKQIQVHLYDEWEETFKQAQERQELADMEADYAVPDAYMPSDPKVKLSQPAPLMQGGFDLPVNADTRAPATPVETTDTAAIDAAVAEATGGKGLMSKPSKGVMPMAEDNDPVGDPARVRAASQFYKDIGTYAETDHGSTPVATKDSREAHLPVSERTRDVAFGHKVTDAEEASGRIHGVTFKDAEGNYVALSEEDKVKILNEDMAMHRRAARKAGWDTKLKRLGKSWYDLDPKYQLALTSLAYNVGGTKAGKGWTAVLRAAVNEDVTGFARELRRQDNQRNTAGMDNRVLKELYYAGIITNRSQVDEVLPLGDHRSGVPE